MPGLTERTLAAWNESLKIRPLQFWRSSLKPCEQTSGICLIPVGGRPSLRLQAAGASGLNSRSSSHLRRARSEKNAKFSGIFRSLSDGGSQKLPLVIRLGGWGLCKPLSVMLNATDPPQVL